MLRINAICHLGSVWNALLISSDLSKRSVEDRLLVHGLNAACKKVGKFCVSLASLSLTSSVSLPAVCVQILDEGQFSKQHQWQNRSVTEWTSQQVARWLMGLNLEHHIPEFTAQNIDGEQLLKLESPELKVSYTFILDILRERAMRGLCQVTFL